MNDQRGVWVLLAAAGVVSFLAVDEANAFPRRVYVAPMTSWHYYQPVPTYGYYYNPYVLPLPAYGILPPTFEGTYPYDARLFGGFRSSGDYGYLDTPARKRSSLYPAVPFERSPEDQAADLRRVRFEITVPYADAIVFFDGAQTKQAGLVRSFMTPPLQEDKEYTVTIKVQWPTEDGTLSKPRQKTFTVKARETVHHKFTE